jgi:hypothetical protein
MSYANLTQSTIDNIFISLSQSGVTGGSYRLGSQSNIYGISSPSIVGLSAISVLLSRGWTGSTD